jgi:hypothetical protein
VFAAWHRQGVRKQRVLRSPGCGVRGWRGRPARAARNRPRRARVCVGKGREERSAAAAAAAAAASSNGSSRQPYHHRTRNIAICQCLAHPSSLQRKPSAPCCSCSSARRASCLLRLKRPARGGAASGREWWRGDARMCENEGHRGATAPCSHRPSRLQPRAAQSAPPHGGAHPWLDALLPPHGRLEEGNRRRRAATARLVEGR